MAFTDKVFGKLKYIDDKLFAYGGSQFEGYVEVEPNIYTTKYSFAILYKDLDGSWIDGGLQEILLNTNRTDTDKYRYDYIKHITKPSSGSEYFAIGNSLTWNDATKTGIYGISISGSGALVNTPSIDFVPTQYDSSDGYFTKYFDGENCFNIAQDVYNSGESTIISANLSQTNIRSYPNLEDNSNGIMFLRNDGKIIGLSEFPEDASTSIRLGDDILRVEYGAKITPEWNVPIQSLYSRHYRYALLDDDRLLVVNSRSREYAIYGNDLSLRLSPSFVDSGQDDSVGQCSLLKNNITGDISLLWYTAEDGWKTYTFDQTALTWTEQLQTTPISNYGFSIKYSGFTGSYYYVIATNGMLYYSLDLSEWTHSTTGYNTMPSLKGEGLHFFDGYYYLIRQQGQGASYKLIRTTDFLEWEIVGINDDYQRISKCIAVANKLIIFAGSGTDNMGLYLYDSSQLVNPVEIFEQTLSENYSIYIRHNFNFLLATINNDTSPQILYVNDAGTVNLSYPAFIGRHSIIDNKYEFIEYHDLERDYFTVCDANIGLTNLRTVPNPIRQNNIQNANSGTVKIIFDGNSYKCFVLYNTVYDYHIYSAEADVLAPSTQWKTLGDFRISRNLINPNDYFGIKSIAFNGKTYLLTSNGTFLISKDAKDWYFLDFYAEDPQNIAWKPRVLSRQFSGYGMSNVYQGEDSTPEQEFIPFKDTIYVAPNIIISDPKSYTVDRTIAEYDKIPNYINYIDSNFSPIESCQDYLIFNRVSNTDKNYELYAYNGETMTPIVNGSSSFGAGVDEINFSLIASNGNSVVLNRYDYAKVLVENGGYSYWNYEEVGTAFYYLEEIGGRMTVRWVIEDASAIEGWSNIYIYFMDDDLLIDLPTTALLINKTTGAIDDSSLIDGITYTPDLAGISPYTSLTKEPSVTAISYPYVYRLNDTYEFIGTDISAELPFLLSDGQDISGDEIYDYFYDSSINAYIVILYHIDTDTYSVYKSNDLQTFQRITGTDALFEVPSTKVFYDYSECERSDPITAECIIKIGEYEAGVGELYSVSNNIDFYTMNGYTLINIRINADYFDSNTNYGDGGYIYRWYKTTDWETFTQVYFPKNYNPNVKTLNEYYVSTNDEYSNGRTVVDITASIAANKFAIGVSPTPDGGGVGE